MNRKAEGNSLGTMVALVLSLALAGVLLLMLINAKNKGGEQASQFVDCTKYIGTVGGGKGYCAAQIDCSDVAEAHKNEYNKWLYIGGWGCEKAQSAGGTPTPYCCAGSEKVEAPQEAPPAP